MHNLQFLRKIKKTMRSDQQEPPKCGSARGLGAFNQMIRRCSLHFHAIKPWLSIFSFSFTPNLPGLLH